MLISRVLMDTATDGDAGGAGGDVKTAEVKVDAKVDAGKPDVKTEAKPSGSWPDNWQAQIAGDNPDELKQIARYQSPADIWKKARSLEKRLSSGELRPAMPKDAKPEEMAAWRKDAGIPESPEKYDLKGIEVPEVDQEIIKGFLKNAHGANFTPDQAKVAVDSYYKIVNSQIAQQEARDEDQRLQAIDTLAQEWGGKFSGYKNRISNYLAMFPESVRDAMGSARLPDGTALFNNVDVLKTIVAMSLNDIPDGVHVPAEGGDIGKSALDEYKDIQKLMRENRTDYNRDAGKQQRFNSLIEYLSKQGLIDAQGNEVVKQKRAA